MSRVWIVAWLSIAAGLQVNSSFAREMPPAPVVVVEARQMMLAPTGWVPASVVSLRDADIATEVDGRLVQVIEVGSRVEKDKILAKVDDTTYRLQLDEFRANVSRAKANLKFLKQELARLKQLAVSNNAARTRLEQTEAERDIARSDLALSEARLQQVRERLKRTAVRAPFAGVIAERYLQSGEWAGNGSRVVRLVDVAALQVRAMVSLKTRHFLSIGDVITLSSDGNIVSGTVSALATAGDSLSRLLDLRIAVDQPDWTVGQTVRVAVPLAQARQVVAVPRDALVLRRKGVAVFRINADEMAERVAVSTGISQGELIELLGDVNPGDQIVVRGGERLRPGQKVRRSAGVQQ